MKALFRVPQYPRLPKGVNPNLPWVSVRTRAACLGQETEQENIYETAKAVCEFERALAAKSGESVEPESYIFVSDR